jgi:hypothetical protein
LLIRKKTKKVTGYSSFLDIRCLAGETLESLARIEENKPWIGDPLNFISKVALSPYHSYKKIKRN